jgi:16S rRNA G966 N2-methylase RsmD
MISLNRGIEVLIPNPIFLVTNLPNSSRFWLSLIRFRTQSMSTAQREMFSMVRKPQGYRGLHAFHKYWGKKPAEPLSFLIENLTSPGALVVDPFMGSCASGIESVRLGRRFIGIDLNPIAVRLGTFLLTAPKPKIAQDAFLLIERSTKDRIQRSYQSTLDDLPITHYLWNGSTMVEMWVVTRRKNGRRVYRPSEDDLALATQYKDYTTHIVRQPRFFNNSRINSNSNLSLHDLFSGRALRNIEILLEAILLLDPPQQAMMQLALTAALGQMSKMVFAISGRGKASGAISEKVEVGSWVIGFWRPTLHFEVNVWNCFALRVQKLIYALGDQENQGAQTTIGTIAETLEGLTQCSVEAGDVLSVMNRVPDQSIDLLLTDPPHGDRIPYLELSELWNSVLGFEVDFSNEIVVSNAKERQKNSADYSARMKAFVSLAMRKVKQGGVIAIVFNARDASSWEFFSDFEAITESAGLIYQGYFPLMYSAGSVVQDNRAGSLKSDFALIFSSDRSLSRKLQTVPDWSRERPNNFR